MQMAPKEPKADHDDRTQKHPDASPDRSDEEILRDEAQTERQAPDNAGPGEAAGS